MNIDLVSMATAVAVIIGIVNGVQLVFKNNPKWTNIVGFVSFVIALVLGIVFGYFQWFGLASVQIGLIAGLSSSGLFKLSQNLGGK